MYVGFFFFKQKTAYELRISDWSSDVCASDLLAERVRVDRAGRLAAGAEDLEAVTGPRAKRGLGQHAAGRVSGAKKQDATLHRLDPGGRNAQPLRSAGAADRRAERAGLVRRHRASDVGPVGDETVHGVEPGPVAEVAAAVNAADQAPVHALFQMAGQRGA